MIVVGVDPGARHTAVTVVSRLRAGSGAGLLGAGVTMLGTVTVEREPAEPMLDVGRGYLLATLAAINDAVRNFDADLIACEGLRRPTGFARGQRHSLDPGPLVACGITLGAILGRAWAIPLVIVPPGGNGSRPLAQYPPELRPTRGRGAGHDALRHARSAYDTALRGPEAAALSRALGTMGR